MTINIEEFNIGQYRGIKDLSLKELNHVNVFTGKNDTGKTSILELIDTLSNPLRSDVWQNESYGSHFSRISIFTELYRLFPYDQVNKQIAYDFMDNRHQKHFVKLDAQISQSMISSNELTQLNGYINTGDPQKNADERQPADLLEIQASYDNLSSHFAVYDRQTTLKAPQDKSFYMNTIYLSPEANDRKRNADFFVKIIEDDELKRMMLSLLKDLDDSIIDFNLINDEFVIKKKNAKKFIPLSLFGDGIKKAVDLMTATLLAPNGLLLIDEFETSIHPSALKRTLLWVIKTAMRNNTQIFLTTHSLDTLSKICQLDEDVKKNINIYTLYHNDTIRVRMLNAVMAAEVSEMGVSLL